MILLLKTSLFLIVIALNMPVFASKCQMIHDVAGYTPVENSEQLQSFRWLAFAEGKILATGSESVPKTYSNCQKLDGRGAVMLPGLIDAHGHVSSLGNELLSVQLRGATSESEAVERVTSFAEANADQKWILGRGWNQVLWPGKSFPTRHTLDKTGIERPIVLGRIDAHAAWLNSAALKAAGIDDTTPDPEGGKIIRDEKGKATGVLIDNAIKLVERKIPSSGEKELNLLFDKAFHHLLQRGIVSVHDAGVGQADLDVYLQRQKTERLPVRIYGMLSGDSPHLESWLKRGRIQDEDDRLSIQSVKLYSDGALGSRGAALLKPYTDDKLNFGLLLINPKQLGGLVEKIIDHNFQVNVHAIGDRGNRLVLDTFEKVYKTGKGRSLRNRIEHAQVVALKDIPRFKALDIIASMQPTHATSDKNMAGDRIGKTRLRGAYAWQKFLQQGTIIASGSDFPVEYANPFFGLHAAVTRQDMENEPKGGWLPSQKMTVAQALRSFTLDAAYAAHQEKTLGSLETGKWADFILIDQDITKVAPEKIWKTKVKETWIAGKRVYRNPELVSKAEL